MSNPQREEQAAWLRLTLVPGVTPKAQRAWLKAFGSPAAVLAADTARLAEIAPEAAVALRNGPDSGLLERTLDWLQAPGRHLVALDDARYPRMLLEAGCAPSVLYACGRVDLLNAPTFAIVGSRNATPLGLRDAEAFARTLSDAGLCIASGLALGIDAAAHRGGLAGASSSVAVLGTGADIRYPARNAALACLLEQDGCVVTEFALGTPSDPRNFPRRNRLISGLARGVLVVEAAEKSGSRITAGYAAAQGRDVFAIPGSIHSPLSRGCHALIQQGAKLVERAEDILVEFAMMQAAPARRDASGRSHPLLEAMGFSPIAADELAARTGLAAGAIAAGLSRLEIEGRVNALAGGWFQRIDPA